MMSKWDQDPGTRDLRKLGSRTQDHSQSLKTGPQDLSPKLISRTPGLQHSLMKSFVSFFSSLFFSFFFQITYKTNINCDQLKAIVNTKYMTAKKLVIQSFFNGFFFQNNT